MKSQYNVTWKEEGGDGTPVDVVTPATSTVSCLKRPRATTTNLDTSSTLPRPGKGGLTEQKRSITFASLPTTSTICDKLTPYEPTGIPQKPILKERPMSMIDKITSPTILTSPTYSYPVPSPTYPTYTTTFANINRNNNIKGSNTCLSTTTATNKFRLPPTPLTSPDYKRDQQFVPTSFPFNKGQNARSVIGTNLVEVGGICMKSTD